MAFVGGMMGQFMKPIPLNVPVALAVSLFVAYVFAPYLARKFIKFEKHESQAEEDTDIKEDMVLTCEKKKEGER
jgi:multidrug efflux pump subunit AcrB